MVKAFARQGLELPMVLDDVTVNFDNKLRSRGGNAAGVRKGWPAGAGVYEPHAFWRECSICAAALNRSGCPPATAAAKTWKNAWRVYFCLDRCQLARGVGERDFIAVDLKRKSPSPSAIQRRSREGTRGYATSTNTFAPSTITEKVSAAMRKVELMLPRADVELPAVQGHVTTQLRTMP